MGRITIFTGNDTLSKKAKGELEKRCLPYTELSVEVDPKLLSKQVSLCSNPGVPQVFFNSRYIGGTSQLVKELKIWDGDEVSPLARYEREISPMPDPSRIPDPSPRDSNASKRRHGTTKRSKDKSLVDKECNIKLPNGENISAPDMIRRLRMNLPLQAVERGGRIVKNAFTGSKLVKFFIKFFGVTDLQGYALGQLLSDYKLIHHIDNQSIFKASKVDLYQLQCDKTPDILNSYRLWKGNSSRKPVVVVEELNELLTEIENAAVNSQGDIDYRAASESELFARFEDEVCELQVVKISQLCSDKQQLKAFFLNTYLLMRRYAFVKVGIPDEKTNFLKSLRFVIGGLHFSFWEVINGVLRGNQPDMDGKTTFKLMDRRKKFSISGDVDHRVHFALNLGSAVGSEASLPFSMYTGADLDGQLDIAARVFCGQECTFSYTDHDQTIHLARCLSWNRVDFGSTNSRLVACVQNSAPDSQKGKMKEALGNFRTVQFHDVEWGLDAINFVEYSTPSDCIG